MPHKQTEEQAKRAFSDGSSQAAADMASDPKKAVEEHRRIDAPTTHSAQPDPEGVKHDHMAERQAAEGRQEALLDEAIEETFPGSDPISPKHIT